ncbi:MAG: SemiSWEET transporter [Chitinophagaceae bacterium]|nr:SemiSWEET transporter [Chitinophagaceae bacterium]
MNEEILGIAAGVCTSVSMLPQLFKIIKEKKAENISYFMMGILMVGLIGWVWYGSMKKDLPIILTNCFSILVNTLLIVFAIKYKENIKGS